MPPQIVLIRHAQGLHNVNNKSHRLSKSLQISLSWRPTNIRSQEYHLHDPELTELGISQCHALKENLVERFGNVPAGDVAVIVSPMLRTLQTATLALDWLRDKGVKFEARAEWQENGTNPCDVGRPVAEFVPQFPHVDFTKVDPVWTEKTAPAGRKYAQTKTAVVERGRLCLEDLYNRPQKLVFVVSHSGFMRAGVSRSWFANADYRVFEFLDEPDRAGDVPPSPSSRRAIKQDESTLSGGMGLSWTVTVELGEGLPDTEEEEHSKT